MAEITIADLQTIGDVADLLAEQADGLGATEAIQLLDAALAAQVKLKAAIDMLQAQALRTIEQPIVIGHTVYSKKRVIKRRPDQLLIQGHVANAASKPDENGEVPTSFDAAVTATRLMAGLYVSPSTPPKVGGVQALGLSIDDVCASEHTGWEIRRTEMEQDKDE